MSMRPIADEVVERACIAAALVWNPVNPWEQWSDEDKAKGRAVMRAALESALPRGLPAGRDAKLRDALKAAREWIVSHGAFMSLTLIDRIDDSLTTAEQPSCGQDADMAALDWIEAMHTLHGSVEFLYVVDGYEVRITKDDGNSWALLGSGPTLRAAIKEAIAAQQRQGGAK